MDFFDQLAGQFPDGTFLNFSGNLKGAIAVILASLVCGSVGSLVVGNRMAFFSDALAHCALAGVGLALLLGLLGGWLREPAFFDWGVPLLTVGFGVAVGLGIAFVRDNTSLASDTVIGVFFAGALGLGAVLLRYLAREAPSRVWSMEALVFGDPLTARSADLFLLAALVVLAAVLLAVMYNNLVFTSFNTSLARSRRIPVRLCGYLFVVLLAVLVNVCLRVVGALLINAMLVVPAAAAANVSRNMRQLFWVTIALCLVSGVGGLWVSWDVARAGTGGSIVIVSVLLFFASMLFVSRPVRRLWEERVAPALRTLTGRRNPAPPREAPLANSPPGPENSPGGDEPAGPDRT